MNKLNLIEISTDAEISISVMLRLRLRSLSTFSPDYIHDRVCELFEVSRLTSWLAYSFEQDYLLWYYGLDE